MLDYLLDFLIRLLVIRVLVMPREKSLAVWEIWDRVTAKGLRLLRSIDTVLDMFEGKELVDLRY